MDITQQSSDMQKRIFHGKGKAGLTVRAAALRAAHKEGGARILHTPHIGIRLLCEMAAVAQRWPPGALLLQHHAGPQGSFHACSTHEA